MVLMMKIDEVLDLVLWKSLPYITDLNLVKLIPTYFKVRHFCWKRHIGNQRCISNHSIAARLQADRTVYMQDQWMKSQQEKTNIFKSMQ